MWTPNFTPKMRLVTWLLGWWLLLSEFPLKFVSHPRHLLLKLTRNPHQANCHKNTTYKTKQKMMNCGHCIDNLHVCHAGQPKRDACATIQTRPPSGRGPSMAIHLSHFIPQMYRSECRKLFAMPSISHPGWPHSVSVISDSSPAHRHPNEPWHWLQAFLQTENTGPSNSISTLRLSSPDYKAGCGCCPTGTRLIFHALRYLLQTIRPLRLFLLMWKMWGCFI